MPSTYVNNLRLEEIATGEQSGTWGNTTNTNLELIGQALGYGTRAIASAATDNITIADGASDADRSMYLKLTGGNQNCTITLLPNTSSKMWVMENATSHIMTFTQGSGANVSIPAGQTKMIFADGLGSGAVVYELGTLAVGGVQSNGTVTVGVDDTGHDVTFHGATAGKKLLWDESADALIVTGDGTFQGLDTSAISGIIEANANFIDMCLVGPSVDGMAWKGAFSNGAVWTSLMLATVETSGSDAQVNIWDLTSSTLASATPLATLTLSGATPTGISASMGYVMVSTSDQGVHVVSPHETGAWAEKTQGWPRSLTTTGTNLSSNNVVDVAGGGQKAAGMPYDPWTWGVVPTFWVNTDTHTVNLLKADGEIWRKTATTGSNDHVGCDSHGVGYWSENGGSQEWIRLNSEPVANITANNFGHHTIFDPDAGATLVGPGGAYAAVSATSHLVAGASSAGLALALASAVNGAAATAIVTRAYNSGYQRASPRGAWLANSDTADRSGNSNTLTENGTVTEAVVASGAELKGYSGFTADNNLTRASDSNWDVIGNGAASVTLWFKSSGNSADEYLFGISNAGNTVKVLIILKASGTVEGTFDGASAAVSIASTAAYDDGVWHRVDVVRRSNTDHEVYVDALSVGSSATDTGSISDSGNLPLAIGANPSGSGNPAATSAISLVRLSASGLSANQIKKAYEAETPMFAANAKCLLQSGSTDAVLDAAVDPLTGKVIVTQTDTQDIFNGLAIETERTIATGGSTFEHGLLWGDAVSEINNANLFASTPATDQRQVNEMVRSLSAGLPDGADLSEAKAWLVYNQSTNSILSSFNIESVTDVATGRIWAYFAVPFKNTKYVGVGTADATQTTSTNNTNTQKGYQEFYTIVSSTGALQDAGRIGCVWFGELDNE